MTDGSTSSSSDMPGSSAPPGTTMTTTFTTSETDTDAGDTEWTTSDPPPPDVPVFDCRDDECPEGQWCGPSHQACQPIEEVAECVQGPAHRVVAVDAVVGAPVAVRTADVDGDLDDDVIVLWDDAVTVVVQNAGLTSLVPQALDVAGLREVDVGDLDADGVPDLVVSSAASLSWAPGLGDGTFGPLTVLVEVAGPEFGGFGIGPAGDGDEADDVLLFLPDAATLGLGLNGGSGLLDDVVTTELPIETPGAFRAIDRGFSDLIAAVGSVDFVYTYVPDAKTFEMTEATSRRLTHADLPIIDVDLVRAGGGVHTFGFVNLGSWTIGGYTSTPEGIATPSRLIVGNGAGGFDYAYVTEDDRVLVIDGTCYDAHDLGAAPVAADAGDFDDDGRGDLAIVMDGIPLTVLLSGPE